MSNLYEFDCETKTLIADNLVAFMNDKEPLVQESVTFITNWVAKLGYVNKKDYHDVWRLVLKKYLHKERLVLFRFCSCINTEYDTVSFSSNFNLARSFAKEYDYDGHLIIIDTAEYLNSENQNDVEYEYGIFPLTECIKKGQNLFYDGFYEKYKKEAEYIVRLNPKLICDLRWNTEYMQNQSK